MSVEFTQSETVRTSNQDQKQKLHQWRLNTPSHTKAECGPSGCLGFYVEVPSHSLVVKGGHVHDGKLWKVVMHKPWPLEKLL
jgi:hypothetical protein